MQQVCSKPLEEVMEFYIVGAAAPVWGWTSTTNHYPMLPQLVRTGKKGDIIAFRTPLPIPSRLTVDKVVLPEFEGHPRE